MAFITVMLIEPAQLIQPPTQFKNTIEKSSINIWLIKRYSTFMVSMKLSSIGLLGIIIFHNKRATEQKRNREKWKWAIIFELYRWYRWKNGDNPKEILFPHPTIEK